MRPCSSSRSCEAVALICTTCSAVVLRNACDRRYEHHVCAHSGKQQSDASCAPAHGKLWSELHQACSWHGNVFYCSLFRRAGSQRKQLHTPLCLLHGNMITHHQCWCASCKQHIFEHESEASATHCAESVKRTGRLEKGKGGDHSNRCI